MRTSFVRTAVRWILTTITAIGLATAVARGADTAQPNPVPDHEKRIKKLEETVDRLKEDTRQVEANLEGQIDARSADVQDLWASHLLLVQRRQHHLAATQGSDDRLRPARSLVAAILLLLGAARRDG